MCRCACGSKSCAPVVSASVSVSTGIALGAAEIRRHCFSRADLTEPFDKRAGQRWACAAMFELQFLMTLST